MPYAQSGERIADPDYHATAVTWNVLQNRLPRRAPYYPLQYDPSYRRRESLCNSAVAKGYRSRVAFQTERI